MSLLELTGRMPSDDLASRERGLWVGRSRNGRVPVRAELLPDVAA